MTKHHLAQVNIGRMAAPIDHAIMADFVAALAPINALADASPGFVWRFQTAAGNATEVLPYDDKLIIINFSVWESVESLKSFVYKNEHGKIMRYRNTWFDKLKEAYLALWWVPAGHIPTWEQARARLDSVQAHGPTPYAFTFKRLFAPSVEQP